MIKGLPLDMLCPPGRLRWFVLQVLHVKAVPEGYWIVWTTKAKNFTDVPRGLNGDGFDDVDALSITETIYKGKIRPYGKTDGSLTDVHLPSGLAEELRLWKQETATKSRNGSVSQDAFIFPNSRGGFLDTGNYRNRVLNPLAEKLGLPKLNFQVMRRTMVTQAQAMGSVKDIQAHLRHAKADTTANEYMQELPESVKKMVGSVYTMLTKGGESKQASGDLLPKATNLSEPLAVSA